MIKTVSTTFEKLELWYVFGSDDVIIDVEIELDYLPGEPAVRYYADGSGYPGAPPEAEVIGCSWTHIHLESGYIIDRKRVKNQFEFCRAVDEVCLQAALDIPDPLDMIED